MPLYLPDPPCPRQRNDCSSLSQIQSDCGQSFVCCGEVKEPVSEPVDRFRLCWKNPNVDEMGDYSFRDIVDTITVLSGALSADINRLGKDDIQ